MYFFSDPVTIYVLALRLGHTEAGMMKCLHAINAREKREKLKNLFADDFCTKYSVIGLKIMKYVD